MPKASKETASEHEALEGYEGHFEHFEGGWTVAFEAYTQDADLSPFFRGLPNEQRSEPGIHLDRARPLDHRARGQPPSLAPI